MMKVGCYLIGEAGLDPNRVVAAISSMKPMDVVHARKLIALAIAALKYANTTTPTTHWYSPSTWALPDQTNAIDRRQKMIENFQNIDDAITSSMHHLETDILPEGAAAILRDHAIQAIWEFNSVAEGDERFSGVKSQFYTDVENNAKDLAKKGYGAAKAAVDWTVDTAKGVEKKAAWYANVVLWTALGVGVMAAGAISYGVYRRVSGR